MYNTSEITAEQWSALGSILTGGATIALVLITALGLRQWFEQLKGTNKYELAKRIALLAIQFQSRYKTARFGLTTTEEAATRPRRDDEDISERLRNDEYYARAMRLNALTETFNEL